MRQSTSLCPQWTRLGLESGWRPEIWERLHFLAHPMPTSAFCGWKRPSTEHPLASWFVLDTFSSLCVYLLVPGLQGASLHPMNMVRAMEARALALLGKHSTKGATLPAQAGSITAPIHRWKN